ncbi:MAG: 1,4-alpha-glucan branching protein GlgB [Polyangiaceae bacterium]|nr:1,4-alpha-glucan branching protein GlgB [Polyangiaceae bacterium]
MLHAVRHDVTRLSEEDLYLFAEGTHTRLYEKLGAHIMTADGVDGTYFAVWAPNAEQVTVVGDFNGWDRTAHPLAPRSQSGIWEGFVPGIEHGTVYKYFITSRFGGYAVEKADPFAFRAETPPQTASIVWNIEKLGHSRRKERRTTSHDKPVSIYEAHVGSFRRMTGEHNRPYTYRELAKELPEYVSRMGFTHVELLPVMEHPFGGSWGYQVTGFFAPTSRYGDPEDFAFLVDALHEAGLGVILDWVPSHFPSDEHGLGYFDGTYLFEHADPRKGFHPDWKSLIFNYGRGEVVSFLLSSAHFWLDRYHADALRVDAVASMLYLDYSRKHGEWEPNRHGGRENLEAIDFLRRLNESIGRTFPDAHTIAEESTSWPMVSRPTYVGGLGFAYKWDMGWMHDTLEYMASDPVFRKFIHNKLTFRMMYAFSENFVLPLSHDEVVHMKGSLIGKMKGDEWQKFANLRVLYAYFWTQPGKKLLFMGGEIAQKAEWAHEGQLDWHLLEEGPYHVGIKRFVQTMNRLYAEKPALHELDTSPDGFQWIDCNDADHSVVVYFRRARSTDAIVVVALNFTPVPRQRYRIGLPRGGRYHEILSSDAVEFGGAGMTGGGDFIAESLQHHNRHHSAEITIPPLGAVFYYHAGLAVSDRPLGATYLGDDRTGFRLWAPLAHRVDVVIVGEIERRIRLEPENGAYWHAVIDGVSPGSRYYFDIGRGTLFPDPASRLQPEGVFGPSEVVPSVPDPAFGWSGRSLHEYVIYEMHIGTFTREGTFDAAIRRLPELKELGITAIEIMPVAAFPGTRNWGYDGAYPFAVHSGYGGPDGLRRLAAACHSNGMALILDVVYNHLGPEGTHLAEFGPYFSAYHRTPWGEAVNSSGPHSDEVRKFFIESALYFVTHIGIDALRLDAVNALVDLSPRPFLEELAEVIHRRGAELGRQVYLMAESDDNDPRHVKRASDGGHGLDALWNDDFHHALLALLTTERTGALVDHGRVEHLAKAIRENFVFTGQYSQFKKRRHGRSGADLDPRSMIVFAQNHDQVGNRPAGDRLSTRVSFDKQKLAAAVVLLSPFLPLVFMGEEYGETAPFPYFTDFADAALAEAVERGRKADLERFGFTEAPPIPQDQATFQKRASTGIYAGENTMRSYWNGTVRSCNCVGKTRHLRRDATGTLWHSRTNGCFSFAGGRANPKLSWCTIFRIEPSTSSCLCPPARTEWH